MTPNFVRYGSCKSLLILAICGLLNGSSTPRIVLFDQAGGLFRSPNNPNGMPRNSRNSSMMSRCLNPSDTLSRPGSNQTLPKWIRWRSGMPHLWEVARMLKHSDDRASKTLSSLHRSCAPTYNVPLDPCSSSLPSDHNRRSSNACSNKHFR